MAQRAGLLAALGLALSTDFASLTRYGIEGALLPVVELIAVAFLWRGLRGGFWLDFVLAGLFVGLSQYIYIVARFFPVALAAASIGAIVAHRRLLCRWRGLIWAALVAALAALPQWLLFIRTPYTLTARTQQSAGQFIFDLSDPLPILSAKLMNQLLMLGWYWDNAYNPFSYKPLLTPMLVIGLLVSVVMAFYKRGAAHIFSLILMVVMLLPDLLAYEGITPSATRLAPAFAFIFMMAGLGGAIIWEWIARKSPLPAWVGYLVPGLVLCFGLLRQWDYAARVIPQIYAADGLEWQASLVEIAEADYIANHLHRPILLPSSEYQRAPLTFLLADYFPQRAGGLKQSPRGEPRDEPLKPGEVVTVVQPIAPDRPTTEGIPAGYIPDEWVLLKDKTAYFLPPLPDSIEPIDDEPTPVLSSRNVLVAEAFSARWQASAPEYNPLAVSFTNHLNLVGYQTNDLRPGQPLLVTFYWQPKQRIEADVEVFVQLLDQKQEVVASIHSWPLHGAFRIRAWQPGATMPLSYSLPMPADLSPGPYQLIVGTFDLLQRQPIPVSSGENFQIVETFKISPPPDNRAPATPAKIDFGNIIRLTGYTLTPTAEGLKTTLFWQAIDAPQTDYTTFIHVVDAHGQFVAQSDAQPLEGQYPTSIWSAGERVIDERVIPIPPGKYQIYVGWYEWRTLERLPLISNKAGATDDRFLLGALKLP